MGLGLGFMALGKAPKSSRGVLPQNSNNCRIVVFGADGLRIDVARQLHFDGSPALGRLNPPICALSGGGLSLTQPGWASIWSGLPSGFHNAWKNDEYSAMPPDVHIMGKFIDYYAAQDGFAVWISGKGSAVRGNIPDSPHYQVYWPIVKQGQPGIYAADRWIGSGHVYSLAKPALQEAVNHQHFCCFVLFGNPDTIGHKTKRYDDFVAAARVVDEYIADLIEFLPPDTDILYCSDHGFNFTELGEIENTHFFAPKGMLATNFSTISHSHVTRESIGRLIFKRGGGDPDHLYSGSDPYAMYGVDL
jgi:hypothetical protein